MKDRIIVNEHLVPDTLSYGLMRSTLRPSLLQLPGWAWSLIGNGGQVRAAVSRDCPVIVGLASGTQ